MTDAEIIEIIADGIVDGTDMDCTPADQARAVLKALRDAGVLPQWRPIETAPRDSKARLVWTPENLCIYCVCWREDPEYPWGGAWVIFGGGYRDVIQRPTHWRPLPEAPQ